MVVMCGYSVTASQTIQPSSQLSLHYPPNSCHFQELQQASLPPWIGKEDLNAAGLTTHFRNVGGCEIVTHAGVLSRTSGGYCLSYSTQEGRRVPGPLNFGPGQHSFSWGGRRYLVPGSRGGRPAVSGSRRCIARDIMRVPGEL